MASSLQPLNSLGTNLTVSKEEFLIFHNIDRQLFTRLVVELGRDTSQSTHVMAFILWLEKHKKDRYMVKNILQWPQATLNTLADEATLVLNCIESSQFLYDDHDNDLGFPLIKNVMQSNAISFKYFYNNRVSIICDVTKLLNDVCVRGFTDIVEQVQYMKAMKEYNLQVANFARNGFPYAKPVVYYNPLPGVAIVPQQVSISTPQQCEESSRSLVGTNPPLETFGVSNREQFNKNFNELLTPFNQISITNSNQTGVTTEAVLVHDRIISMTFSTEHPVAATEVQDFFSRRYGDIVEELYMQPLCAYVVIRENAVHMIDHLLQGKNIMNLSINGKHVWARKYICKGKSPAANSLATSPFSTRPSY